MESLQCLEYNVCEMKRTGRFGVRMTTHIRKDVQMKKMKNVKEEKSIRSGKNVTSMGSLKKRLLVTLLTFLMVLSCACGKKDSEEEASSKKETDSSSASTEQSGKEQEKEITLQNKMTAKEKGKVDKHSLTLLDEPVIPDVKEELKKKHTVKVEMKTMTKEQLLESAESQRDLMTEEEYKKSIDAIEHMDGDEFETINGVMVDDIFMFHPVPEKSYDGGELVQYEGVSTGESPDEVEYKEVTYRNYEEYLDHIKKYYIEMGCSEGKAEYIAGLNRIAWEAIKKDEYVTVPEGTMNIKDASLFDLGEDTFADYRKEWEFDRDAVSAIKDSIDEYSIYDEELDREFLVHVTLPADYDKNKTYPVFFLTDGVWRFGNHPELRKAMEDKEADDVILVSLGYNYHMNGADGNTRSTDLVLERKKLLDFITDNLMPYLGENYKIDYADSTLYGHSDGGVFSHYALFNSDKYDNQPFGHYIIGSPAFWGLYDEGDLLDPKGCETDYGYFDRNRTLDKTVFLCGGKDEDPDYQDRYNGHATTLEGLENLKKRLESHGAKCTCKLYDSHHYQYIPGMLLEYLKETYPAK